MVVKEEEAFEVNRKKSTDLHAVYLGGNNDLKTDGSSNILSFGCKSKDGDWSVVATDRLHHTRWSSVLPASY